MKHFHLKVLCLTVCFLFEIGSAQAQDAVQEQVIDQPVESPTGYNEQSQNGSEQNSTEQREAEEENGQDEGGHRLTENSEWAVEVYERWHPSVFRIESTESVGAGFLFHSNRHVATAYHMVNNGGPVRVVHVDGRSTDAAVVAVDRQNDLAILELDQDFGETPVFEPARGQPRVGEPVVAIGNPFALEGDRERDENHGLFNWSLTQGVVSALSETRIQSDVSLNPGNSGGPLLDPGGHVLGVVVESYGEGVGILVRVSELAELVEEIGADEPYRGRFRFEFGIYPMLDIDRSGVWLGGGLSLGIVGFDRFAFLVRTSLGSLLSDQMQGDVLGRDTMRSSVEFELQYRWAIRLKPGLPMRITLGAGAALNWERESVRRVQAGFAEGCDPLTEVCPIETSIVDEEASSFRAMPMVRLGIRLAFTEITYAFQLDTQDPAASIHRITFGIAF